MRRPLRQFLLRLALAVPVAACAAVLAGIAPVSAQTATWVKYATVSPTTTLSAGSLCYSDGRDIACDGNLSNVTGGLLSDRITSGTAGVYVSSTGVINFRTGGVTTGYFDTAGVLVGPGISVTSAYGVSTTNLTVRGVLDIVTGTNVVLIGVRAGETAVSGSSIVAVGNNSAQQSTGSYVAALGDQAARNNSGSNLVAAGTYAGLYNVGDNATLLGYRAGQQNNGANVVAIGSGAGRYTDGANAVAVGGNAAQYNSGTDVTAVGYMAGMYTSGSYVTLVGSGAGRRQGASSVVGVGYNAAFLNSGTYVTAVGREAAYSNVYDNVTALGYGAASDKANQVILGNSSVVEVTTTGVILAKGVSATGVVSATKFVGDGSGLTNLNLGGSVNDRITSGTAGVYVSDTGVINFRTGGVTTGYFDTAGLLVAPGVSVTSANGISSTNGYFNGTLTVSGSITTSGLNSDIRVNGSYPRMGFWAANATLPTLTYSSDGSGLRYNTTGSRYELLAQTSVVASISSQTWSISPTLLPKGISVTDYGISSTSGYFSGNVGIGTGVPSSSLHIVGSVSSSVGGITLGAGPIAKYGYIYPAGTGSLNIETATTSGGFNFKHGGATSLQVIGAGGGPTTYKSYSLAVGGLTNASATLHISGTIMMGDDLTSCDANRLGAIKYQSGSFYVCQSASNDWEPLVTGGISATLDRISSNSQAGVIANSSGYISFTTGGVTGTTYIDTAGRFTLPGISVTTAHGISSTNGYFSGNVGIGYSTPGYGLQVRGGLGLGGSGASGWLHLYAPNNVVWSMAPNANGSLFSLNSNANSDNFFSIGNTTGYKASVGINISTSTFPSATLHVSGTARISSWTAIAANVTATAALDVYGTVSGTAFVGDGSGLTNLNLSGSVNDRITSGTAGVYVSNTGVINIKGDVMTGPDSAPFYISASTGKIGIGTTQPTDPLTIANGALRLGMSGASNASGTIFLDDQTNVRYTLAASTAGMIFRMNTAGYSYRFYSSAGNMKMSVNTSATPSTTLDVSGSLRIAASGETCDVNRLGAIKYQGGSFYVCQSASNDWEPLVTGGISATLDRISSNSQAGVIANSSGYISFTTGGVTGTTYIDTAGRFTLPGISVTTAHGISTTNLSVRGLLDIVTGTESMFVGQGAGQAMTDFSYNTAVGYNAGYSNTVDRLTAVGNRAGEFNVGSSAVLVGRLAGQYNSGTSNVGIGVAALQYNSATNIVGVGSSAGQYNTGYYGTAVGFRALQNNTGTFVTSVGYTAGQNNTGSYVASLGAAAAQNNKSSYVVAVGAYALQTASGSNLTGVGASALQFSSGSHVTGIGSAAGQNNSGSYVVGVGSYAARNNSGHYATVVGYNAGLNNTYDNVTLLGNDAQASKANQVVLGNGAITEVTTTGVILAAGVSTTGTISATRFAGDGSGLTNLNLSGSVNDRITSGTAGVFVSSTGLINFRTGGVTTGYFDTAGGLVAPSISLTSVYGISTTNAHVTNDLTVGAPTSWGSSSATLDIYAGAATADTDAILAIHRNQGSIIGYFSGSAGNGRLRMQHEGGNNFAEMGAYSSSPMVRVVRTTSGGAQAAQYSVESTGGASWRLGYANNWPDDLVVWKTGMGYPLMTFSSSTYMVGIRVNSPTTSLEVSGTVSATYFVGDGSGLRNISASAISGLTSDRITSGTAGVYVSTTGVINFRTGGVTTGYFDTAGVLVTPGVSATGVVSSAGVYVNGDVSYTGVLTDTSDRRLKTRIAPLDGHAMEKLMLMKPVSFAMKDRPGLTEYGFIAQDVRGIFPELVFTAHDASKTMSMNYIGLIAPMVQGMQELKQENDALKARVEAQEDRLQRLERLVIDREGHVKH